jgi:hypothetical protein
LDFLLADNKRGEEFSMKGTSNAPTVIGSRQPFYSSPRWSSLVYARASSLVAP